MKKIITLAAVTAFTLAACASGPVHSKNDAAGAITAAEHETNRAKKVNYEWRDTGKIIKKAKAALKKGDFDAAVKLANQAKTQSTLALQQYQDQKDAASKHLQ
ncbi:MAG: hypothetical protein PVJ63_08835 [Thioalkalispiraceae bacterium]|jgi:hypothetical protein